MPIRICPAVRFALVKRPAYTAHNSSSEHLYSLMRANVDEGHFRSNHGMDACFLCIAGSSCDGRFRRQRFCRNKYDPQRLEKLVVVGACDDPMQMESLGMGRVLFIERDGSLKLSQVDSPEAVEIGRVPVATFGEVGMLGLAADRDFSRNGYVYLFFCPNNRQRRCEFHDLRFVNRN